MGHSHVINAEDHVLVSDLIDLSVAELLILQFMLQYKRPILRKVLLETLNHTLGEPGNSKSISSSSFYNMTKKLSEREFIETTEEKHIVATYKAKQSIDLINQLTAFASVDIVEKTQNMLADFAEEIQIQPGEIDRILIINLEAGMDIDMLGSIADFAQRTSIAADNQDYQTYQNRGMDEKIEQTRLEDGRIREASEFFDAIVLLGFDCNLTYRHQKTLEWLLEGMRVLKPGGLMTISSLEQLPQTKHFLANAVLDNLRNSYLMHNVGISELTDVMKDIGLKDGKIFNHQGLLIGWGRKPDTS